MSQPTEPHKEALRNEVGDHLLAAQTACVLTAGAFEKEGDHLRAAGYWRLAERLGLCLKAHGWLFSAAGEEAASEEREVQHG